MRLAHPAHHGEGLYGTLVSIRRPRDRLQHDQWEVLSLVCEGTSLYHNAFEPYFYGSFAQEGGRTVVRGRFRPQAIVIAFMAFWFAFVSLIGGVIVVRAVVGLGTGTRAMHGDLGHPGAAALITLGMLAFAVGLLAVGWRMGRGQRERIQMVIEGTLQAHRLTAATDPLSRSVR